MIRLIVFVAVCATVAQGACDGKCNVPVTHYKEIGCEAVFAKPDDCCPSHFNCAQFQARDINRCYLKGNVYNTGDQVDSKVTSKECAAACRCTRTEWEDFTCANIECPEFFGRPNLNPGCFLAYEKDSCCSTKTECPPFDKLATCEVAGKIYREGQKFSPPGKDREMGCICLPNFKGKFEEPFCTPVSCGIELRYSNKIRNNCAPVYYGDSGVCPIQWECDEKDRVVIPNKEGKKSDKKCQFGNKELNIGDKLQLNLPKSSPEINCECRIPPLVSCIQTPHSHP